MNSKIIAEQPVSDSPKLIASFKVPYEPGVLKAIALKNGIEVTSKELRTTGIQKLNICHNIDTNLKILEIILKNQERQ
jgi:hypothetical protein